MGIVVAIDGPSGSGKGTLGRALAAEIGLAYLDTGLIYRAVADKALRTGADLLDQAACWAIADTLQPADMAAPGLRTEAVGQAASRLAAYVPVRAALLDFQRRFAEQPPDGACGAVLDGRDIGTVVCPDADLKIYLTADFTARVLRRYDAALQSGEAITPRAMAQSIHERDTREAQRSISPMKPADDAVVIDTSELTAAEVLEQVVGLVRSRAATPGARRRI